MQSPQPHDEWARVRKITTAEARKKIPLNCYKRSMTKTFVWLGVDLLFFIVGLALICCSANIGLKIFGGLVTGFAAAFLFLWAHDAAHGTLFKSRKFAEIIGTISMLPSLSTFRMWAYGHNKVHHGFTSFTPIDSIWRPLSPNEYRRLSRYQRILYRIERNLFSCGFHYLRQVWWFTTMRFNPGKDKQQRQYYRFGKVMMLIYAVAASALAYYFAGGIIGIVAVVIIPFLTFNYLISLIVYLHHTHPDIPFFDLKKDWSHSVGALYCTTTIKSSKIVSMLLHNIMTHVPHHLDTRIPFYNLPRAHESLRNEYKRYFHEYRFRWRYLYMVFKRCKLYDFELNTWMTFKEAMSF